MTGPGRPRRGRALVPVLALAVLTGCTGSSAGTPRTADPGTPAPASSAPARPTPAEVAGDPRARLTDARVTRTDAGLRVRAWWSCGAARCRDAAIVTVDPGATPRYRRWTERSWYRGLRPDRPVAPAGLDGLLVSTIPSLDPGVRALVGGHDGATLFPFEKVARSTDGGASWTTYDVAEVDGERGYLGGDVVLPDGRLLALVTDWSGDRDGRPSAVHHGFWVSDGDDWGTLAPVSPSFDPPLADVSALDGLRASRSPLPVLWTSTEDRLYASTDGGRTFTETRAR